MCYCPTPTLHLNLALTGDGAFLFSLKKTHTVWFISVLNYGDTENVLINHLLLVIPMSYPCYYTNLCPHKPHKHAHTHTHTHKHTHTHTHTHTHSHSHSLSLSLSVGFYGLRGLSIGVMVFILYKLYVILTYTYPTPKLSPHRRLHFYFPPKNSLCMIYKRFELCGHWKCPHKSPSPCNTYVIPMSLYKFVSS